MPNEELAADPPEPAVASGLVLSVASVLFTRFPLRFGGRLKLSVSAQPNSHLLNYRTGSTLKSNSTQSKFHVGQKVRVVAGTKDPDYGFSIGGWSGSIEEIVLSEDGSGAWLYDIHWNSNTLKAMGRALHKKCEKDNFDVTRMVLAEHEVVVHSPHR